MTGLYHSGCDSSLQAGNEGIWDVENMENSQIVAFV